MIREVPRLEDAYVKHRGLLLSALGRLAREGYRAPPTESLDIVHDFFVEEWGGVASRYDPARASLTTYMYAAFVQFARPRIVRVQRLRASLVDPSEFYELLEDAVADDPGDALDLSRVRQAIANLPSEDRSLLDAWLNANRASERNVARRLGLSRYGVRRRLIEALGRVVTALGSVGARGSLDHQVARAVWGEQLSLAEAAARCNVPRQAIRNAYARNQRRMQMALETIQRAPAQAPGRSIMDEYLKDLVERVRKRPHDEDLLSDIHMHAAELVAFLERSPDDSPLKAWEDLDADWLADVYSALAVGLGETEHPDLDQVPLFEADKSDRERVGAAFEQSLMPALPRQVDDLVARIRPLGLVRPNKNSLLAEPDVYAGGEGARQLAGVGVTPVHLVLASDAVGLLVGRATSAQYFPHGESLSVERDDGAVTRVVVRGSNNELHRAVLVEEICAMTALASGAAEVLLDWLVNIAPCVAELFIGYSAAYSSGNISLSPLVGRRNERNLFYRWRGTVAI